MDQGQYFYKPEPPKRKGGISPWVVLVAIMAIAGILGFWFYQSNEKNKKGKPIEINNGSSGINQYGLANTGEVSPISGLACENWNRRAIAVMQPADEQARPLAGLSEADMVVEMPVLPDGTTRLMGVYICGNPEEVGSMRSVRHDFLHIAKSLDAVIAHWGGAQFAKEKLNEGLIQNINCNNDGGQSSAEYCFRKDGFARGVDSGYVKFAQLLKAVQDYGYGAENRFSGYAHQGEAPMEDRIEKGILKVGFASSTGSNYVEYEYNKETNSYLRFWGKEADVDRNNGERIAPKNIAVLIASQEIKIDDNNTVYNNVQLGDPWYDTKESGEAYYYFNGKEIRGQWRKDKSKMDSKLIFLDQNGSEVKFVPGQIWVEVLEPGRALKWKTAEDIGDEDVESEEAGS